MLLPGFTTLLSFFLLLLTLSTSLPLGKTNKQTKNVACPRTPGGCGGAGLDLGPWKPSSVFLLCYVTASNSSFLLKKKRERLVVVFFFFKSGAGDVTALSQLVGTAALSGMTSQSWL